MTVGSTLKRVTRILARAGLPEPRRDAEVLLGAALGKPRPYLFTHPDADLPRETLSWLARAVRQRRRRCPIPYLLGEQEFYGRTFQVTPAVLIPRPETELLVDRALAILARFPQRDRLGLDLGTGSGCIAITLVREAPRLRMVAVDRSEAALQIAAANARSLQATESIGLFVSDLFSAIREGPSFDLIISNPPYVNPLKWQEVDESVRLYEPSEAVFAAHDGLSMYRRILEEGRPYLAPEGRLVLELGYDVEEGVLEIAASRGWKLCQRSRDLAGIVRCLEFRFPR